MKRQVKVSNEVQVPFPFDSCTKVVLTGNVLGLTIFSSAPKPPPVMRLPFGVYVSPLTGGVYEISAPSFIDKRDGSIHEFQAHAQSRAESVQSLKRTFAKLRNLINANVADLQCMRWVTLTYAENMTDPKRLYTDFDKFWKRFKYYCQTHDIEKPEYISVVEPQGRGAWHVHLLLIWSRFRISPLTGGVYENYAPYLHNDTVFSPLWGHGYTKIKAVRNDCDNIGAYFTAYLADIPVDDLDNLSESEKNAALVNVCEIVERTVMEHGAKRKKAIIKGGRLNMYPSGMNLYRASRGLKKPEITWMSREDAEKKAGSAKPTFRKEYKVVCENETTGKEETVIAFRKEYYNLKSAVSQEVSFKNTDDSAFYDMRVSAELIASLIKDS